MGPEDRTPENPPEPPPAEPVPRPARRWRRTALIALIVLLIVTTLPPLLSWQQMGQQRALSLSNIRRIGDGLLLYTQDWDYRTMAPAEHLPDGSWRMWPELLRPYVTPTSTFSNPSNPVTPFHSTLHHPTDGYPIDSSYALNRRFWNTFSPGPFPFENLELPEQTILFVEAGRMWHNPRHYSRQDATSPPIALLDYGDTLDRIQGLCPYPSTHDGRMAVVAADGHGLIVTVEHYTHADGIHDPLYGRLGGNLYNWNGGHPNGETDLPPRE